MSRGIGRTVAWMAVAAVVLAGLQACGFRLRGTVGQVDLPVIFVQGDGGDQALRVALERLFDRAGVERAAAPADAEWVLQIQKVLQDRRVLTVGSGGGNVQEYQLRYGVLFDVLTTAGEEVFPVQTVEKVRNYTFDENEVLAKGEEQEDLLEEMRAEAAGDMLRRMQILSESKGQ